MSGRCAPILRKRERIKSEKMRRVRKSLSPSFCFLFIKFWCSRKTMDSRSQRWHNTQSSIYSGLFLCHYFCILCVCTADDVREMNEGTIRSSPPQESPRTSLLPSHFGTSERGNVRGLRGENIDKFSLRLWKDIDNVSHDTLSMGRPSTWTLFSSLQG